MSRKRLVSYAAGAALLYQAVLTPFMSHYEWNVYCLEDAIRTNDYYKKKYNINQFSSEFFGGGTLWGGSIYYKTEEEATQALKNVRKRVHIMKQVSPFHILFGLNLWSEVFDEERS